MLDITDLHAEVAGIEILKGINLHVDAGEVHAIMGPNGSGKSTLANVIAGNPSYRVTAGTIAFEGENLATMAHGSFHSCRLQRCNEEPQRGST
jgi:Fe-S cluster assembly ATP-binding protein